MRIKPLHWGAILLALALLPTLPLSVAAQDDDSEALDLISRAYAQLEGASTTYTLMMDSTNRLIDADGAAFGSRQVYDIEGQAAGENYSDTITLTVHPLENESDTQSTRIERVLLDGAFYVQLDDLFTDQLGVEQGWWQLEELRDAIGSDNVQRFAAEQLQHMPTPLAATLDATMIKQVVESEPSTIDGVAVRIFEVEMDALKMAVAQMEGSALERVASYFQNLPLMTHSEFRLVYHLSIGAEDGLLYRSESHAYQYLSFVEFGSNRDPDYDIENESTVIINITYTDTVVEIEAPRPTHTAG